MVCMLALFRIEKTVGSENVEWTKGVTTCVALYYNLGKKLMLRFCRHPLPFPCAFIPRDGEMDAQKLASLIYASCVES